MAAVIAITVTVIIAQCSRLTSMITPANRSAAVIIVNWRHDHEFVIIAPVFLKCFKPHNESLPVPDLVKYYLAKPGRFLGITNVNALVNKT